MQKATVYIYESLKDYANSKCVVELSGVTNVGSTVAGGYFFAIGEEQEEQHAFPPDTIFVIIAQE